MVSKKVETGQYRNRYWKHKTSMVSSWSRRPNYGIAILYLCVVWGAFTKKGQWGNSQLLVKVQRVKWMVKDGKKKNSFRISLRGDIESWEQLTNYCQWRSRAGKQERKAGVRLGHLLMMRIPLNVNTCPLLGQIYSVLMYMLFVEPFIGYIHWVYFLFMGFMTQDLFIGCRIYSCNVGSFLGIQDPLSGSRIMEPS